MATTNFAALTSEELTIWQRQLWRHARNQMIIERFAGTGSDSLIQRITDLKSSAKGARAVMTLIHDLQGDGRVGDNQLEGYEEAGRSTDMIVNIDQLRHAMRHKGRMADQRSVVEFRGNALNNLAYWLAHRVDQLAFLTMSGVAYTLNNDGSTRVGSELPQLEFAADVTAPSTLRHRRWDATTGLEAGSTASVIAADTPTWAMLVELKAYAHRQYLRPVRGEGGNEFFHVFMSPEGMAKLKQDTDYLNIVKDAGIRGDKNQLFKGTDTVMVDGLAITTYRNVYTTLGAVSGAAKWGAGSDVDGQRVLFCGAQALGFADITAPDWVEKNFDFDNQPGISVGKIFGFKKPLFANDHASGAVEDYGIICCDTAI